jgi:hypothetical protein
MSLTLKFDTPQARIFPAVRRFSNAVTMTEIGCRANPPLPATWLSQKLNLLPPT